jgi:SPOR domain
VKNLKPIAALALAGALLACSSSESDSSKLQATEAGYDTGAKGGPARAQSQQPPFEGYRVQLAILPERKDAERSRDSLEARLGGELQGLAVIAPTDSETSYRVASRPMTAAGAEIACAKLLEEHQQCVVVKR